MRPLHLALAGCLATGVTAAPSGAQAVSPAIVVVPAIGIGGVHRDGPQGYAGVQVHRDLSSVLVGVVQAAGWMSIGACLAHVDGTGNCTPQGFNADVGMNVRGGGTSLLRPYFGGGVGIMRVGATAPAINTRVGVALGRLRGASLHLEARAQRMCGAVDNWGGMVSMGVGFGR